MEMHKQDKGFDKNKFHQFVDQDSPQQAAEVQRKWKIQSRNKQNKTYTIIMIGAIILIAIIFMVLIKFLTSLQQKKHFELQYDDKKYRYIQSQQPHLKFLILRDAASVQTRLIKGTGTLYPQLMAWIEAQVQHNNHILFVPNEQSGQGALAVSVGYYLTKSQGGLLSIIVEDALFQHLITNNFQAMRKEHGHDRFPITIISKHAYSSSSQQYNLIIIENNNFYTELHDIQSTNLIIIRKQSKGNTITEPYKSTHNIFQIQRGEIGGDIKFSSWFNFAIKKYVASDVMQGKNIFFVAKSIRTDYPYCSEQNVKFSGREEDRNLIQILRNQTFTHASIYYELSDISIALSLLKLPTISKIYLNTGVTEQNSSFTKIKTPDQMPKSLQNYYFLKLQNFKLIQNSKLITKIQTKQQGNQLYNKCKGYKMNMISPVNNNGCYYPPMVAKFQGDVGGGDAYVVVQVGDIAQNR